MEKPALPGSFFDLKNSEVQETRFFFLNYVLKARADLHLESGLHENDQETNVYLAGLLNSLVTSDAFVRQKEYLSPFDMDICNYLDAHPGTRTRYIVYRDNADFGLVCRGLFQGYLHTGAYQKIVLPNDDPQGRIAVYYELAASALAHLQGSHAMLVPVLCSIADYLSEVVNIMARAAGYYFELMERISNGSMFHLERELNIMDKSKAYSTKVDEFLKAYGEYKSGPTEEGRRKLLALANECSLMNERFKFEEMCPECGERS
jgi:hypothetical protein